MEISQEYSDYQMVLVKGKRTKRPRGLSPVDSSCSSGGDGGGGGGGGGGGVYYSSSASASASPATSTSQISTTNDEDEDMANCLILLARGGCQNGRKLAGMASGGGVGKSELYLYQCKTCNRTFPTFQALGGHRASHKKPKTTVMMTEVEKKSQPLDHHDDDREDKKQSPQISTVRITTPNNNGGKTKIHECSICGSEFSSGQALGGHMRRHRPPPSINPTKPSMSSDGTANVSESSDGREKPNKGVFTLDLNLPAPIEDDDHDQDSKLQNLAFTTPALVDCHY